MEVHLRRFAATVDILRVAGASRLAIRSPRAPATAKDGAKGGSRTPIAFRLPDPKSGASASSATFAGGGLETLLASVARFDTFGPLPELDPTNCGARGCVLPSGVGHVVTKHRYRSVLWFLRSGGQRQRRGDAGQDRHRAGNAPRSEYWPPVARRNRRWPGQSDLPVVLHLGRRRIPVVRGRPPAGLRLPVVRTVRLASRRLGAQPNLKCRVKS